MDIKYFMYLKVFSDFIAPQTGHAQPFLIFLCFPCFFLSKSLFCTAQLLRKNSIFSAVVWKTVSFVLI